MATERKGSNASYEVCADDGAGRRRGGSRKGEGVGDEKYVDNGAVEEPKRAWWRGRDGGVKDADGITAAKGCFKGGCRLHGKAMPAMQRAGAHRWCLLHGEGRGCAGGDEQSWSEIRRRRRWYGLGFSLQGRRDRRVVLRCRKKNGGYEVLPDT